MAKAEDLATLNLANKKMSKKLLKKLEPRLKEDKYKSMSPNPVNREEEEVEVESAVEVVEVSEEEETEEEMEDLEVINLKI